MKKKKNGSSPVTLDGSSKSASKKKKQSKNSERSIKISEFHVKEALEQYLYMLKLIDSNEKVRYVNPVEDFSSYFVGLEVSK